MNKNITPSGGARFLKSILYLLILSLPFLGSDCDENIAQANSVNITGTWRLFLVEGHLQDVCPGEIVNFPSQNGGIATLTCPNSSPLSRQYTFSGDVLVYNETGVSYDASNPQDYLLQLTGIGNVSGRVLSYEKVSSDRNENSQSAAQGNNSSERGEVK